VVGEAVDGHRLARRGGHADDEADLGLDVEPGRRPEDGALGRGSLAVGARDRRAGDDDRARPAVVADRQVSPVGQQRRLPRPEDQADVARVMLRRVEVDVVADRERERQLNRVERDQQRLDGGPVALVGEQLPDAGAYRCPL